MNSCFVSNAAAIAKRKLEQKPKPDKKYVQANSRKQRGSEQKGTTTPQKPVGKDDIRGHVRNMEFFLFFFLNVYNTIK